MITSPTPSGSEYDDASNETMRGLVRSLETPHMSFKECDVSYALTRDYHALPSLLKKKRIF
jgi:hypothetical protein